MKRLVVLLFAVGLLGTALLTLPIVASAQVSVGISVRIGPPPLPVYPQPVVPGPGYIWTPGYWAYGAYGYYWVPGAWVLAPRVGLLWTPGWWGWSDGFYRWHAGYWGPRVGFYGGINYGYGYVGTGYVGGYWRGGALYYNRAVTNVNVTYVHNTYEQKVVHDIAINRVSYNGGQGGISARPTAEQKTYTRERHLAPTAAQMHQERLAMHDPAQRFARNHGWPQTAAITQEAQLKGQGAVRVHQNSGEYVYHPHSQARVERGSGVPAVGERLPGAGGQVQQASGARGRHAERHKTHKHRSSECCRA